jgi:serine/threonine-protein kinase RsbW
VVRGSISILINPAVECSATHEVLRAAPPRLDTIAARLETASKVLWQAGQSEPACAKAERDPVSAPGKGRWKFRLNSTMESVGEVEAAAERVATDAGLDEDQRFHVVMAVREATVNAVLHGNDYDSTRKIDVTLENTGADFIFTVADEGQGFDPDHLPDPLAPENLLRGTGRGIFLIRSLMDEVHFRQLHPGTELTLIEHLAPAAQQT